MTKQTPIEQIRWLPFLNVSGVVIPPFAALEIVADDDDYVISADKPSDDSLAQIVFNSPAEVAVNGNGQCTRDFPAIALYDAADGDPAIGDAYGTQTGSFKLKKDKTGFIIAGDPNTTDTLVSVVGTGGGGPGDEDDIVEVTVDIADDDGYQDGSVWTWNVDTLVWEDEDCLIRPRDDDDSPLPLGFYNGFFQGTDEPTSLPIYGVIPSAGNGLSVTRRILTDQLTNTGTALQWQTRDFTYTNGSLTAETSAASASINYTALSVPISVTCDSSGLHVTYKTIRFLGSYS